MEEQYRAAREAWPEIEVTADRFAAELQRRIAAMSEPVAIDAIKAADVYVAIACVDGNTSAIEAVRAILSREMAFAATKTTASRDQIADAVANLSRTLFVGDTDRPAALHDYSGRGTLASYIRVAAVRELARIVNRDRRDVAVGDDSFLLDKLVPASDPELSIVRAQYREIVDESMRAAIAKLDERERAVLRYAFVEDWSVERIGQALDHRGARDARQEHPQGARESPRGRRRRDRLDHPARAEPHRRVARPRASMTRAGCPSTDTLAAVHELSEEGAPRSS